MFLTRSNTYYDDGGSQHASKAWYLLLATRYQPVTKVGMFTGEPYESSEAESFTCPTCGKAHSALYGAARKIALSQCGHFMMGTARVGGQSVTVSGSFGGDGLPKHMGSESWHTVSDSLLPYFTRLPDAVAASYWHSGEDYHAGKSGDYTALKTWAMAALVYPVLIKAGLAPYAYTREPVNSSRALYRKWRTSRERERAFQGFSFASKAL